MVWIWLFIMIALVFIEILTTNLVTIWYIISAFISLILSVFLKNYTVEFLTFALIGTTLMLLSKKHLINKLVIEKKRKGR